MTEHSKHQSSAGILATPSGRDTASGSRDETAHETTHGGGHGGHDMHAGHGAHDKHAGQECRLRRE